MSQIKTLNGIQYTIPQYNDTGWGANTGNVLTQYMAAIADVTLQLSGGAFTLTADADFGASFGLKALYLISETANPASAGVLRLAKTDAVKWRNNANGADIALAIDGSDNLLYATNKVYTAGGAAGIVNADIASGAAIAYSKLALTGSIVNADINASAAIAYSKLTLTGSIVNADVNASAAIAYSKLALSASIVNADVAAAAAIALTKLAALGNNFAVQTSGSGVLQASTVTATELSYVSGVTSAIQTQLNTAVANPLTGNLAAGSHKLTGLAAGTTAGDSVRFEDVVASALTGFSAASGTITAASTIVQAISRLCNLRIVQYIQGTASTNFSTTSSTFQNSSLAASITPTASTSLILVLAQARIETVAGHVCYMTVKRGSTNLGGSSGFTQVSSASTTAINVPGMIPVVDSPATTSATTYTVAIKNDDNAATVDIMAANQTGVIILIELAVGS